VCLFEGEKQGHRNGARNRRKVCGVVKERVTSINPMVVGSIPTGCESCRSSVVEQRKKNPGPLIPATTKPMWCRYALLRPKERSGQPERCGIEKPPASHEAIAQTIKTRTDRSHRISRDGAEKGYFVCETTRDCGPATLLDFPPGANLPKGDGVGRGEGQGYFAYYAGGRGFDSHLVHRNSQAICFRAGGPVAQR